MIDNVNMALVRTVLQSTKTRWRHHGLGMIQAEIDEHRRVHVWHPMLRVLPPSLPGSLHAPNLIDVHDHRFDLRSTILLGRIEDVQYEVTPVISGFVASHPIYEIKHAKEQDQRASIPRIYLAGPIGKNPGIHRRILDAIDIANAIEKFDCTVKVPHLDFYREICHTRDYERYLQEDFEWITACDALIRMPGLSPGSDREVAFAQSIGLPVFIMHDPASRHFEPGVPEIFREWRRSWVREPDANCTLVGRAQVELLRTRLFARGDVYEIDRRSFHTTRFEDDPTITYVERFEFDDRPARIVGRGRSGIVKTGHNDGVHNVLSLAREAFDAAYPVE